LGKDPKDPAGFRRAEYSLPKAALEYALHFDELSVVIPGAKTPAQVAMNSKPL